MAWVCKRTLLQKSYIVTFFYLGIILFGHNAEPDITLRNQVGSLVVPPTKPVLKEDFITVETNYDNTATIKIPGIVPGTKTKNSFMFVTVCNETGNSTQQTNNFNYTTQVVLSQISCSGSSWIAAAMPTNDSEVSFIVGKSRNTYYDNPPLTGYNNYNICAVLANEYEGQLSFNVYCEEDMDSATTKYIVGGTVLAVSFIFIIVGIIYYIRRDKQQKRTNEEPDIAVAVPLNRNEPRREESEDQPGTPV